LNILTFDIEDWYNCDFITPNLDWSKYEVRIYFGLERILTVLSRKNLKATFFCLGWVAEKHPDIIRWINTHGHNIGCHSYQHELSYRFNREGFKKDTEKAKKLIEDLIEKPIYAFRAPGFSITEQNIWAFEVLAELGFEYDCSVLPGRHDYGGFASYGEAKPAIVNLPNGSQIKEFPVNIQCILGKNLVFSGGGFFRLFPYWIIKHWTSRSAYTMTYFHTRDFDPDQPMIQTLPLLRKFKSYVGLSTSFAKFQRLLNDFEFISVEEAGKLIDWKTTRVIEL